MASFLSTNNLTFYTLPAAYIIAVAPHIYAIQTYRKITENVDSFRPTKPGEQEATAESKEYGFDESQPRLFITRIQSNPDPKLTAEIKDRCLRAEAASSNGYENLGYYAGAVVAANLGLAASRSNLGAAFSKKVLWTNVLCLSYVVTRIGFNTTYIHGARGKARGLWFWSSMMIASALYVRAGNAVRAVLSA